MSRAEADTLGQPSSQPPLDSSPRESDRIYTLLRAMAIRFEPSPGKRLTETDIAARFGVSRTPVREALNRLAKEGLLIVDEHKHFVVRSLDAKECFDLYELRMVLEGASLRLAAERASDQELNALLEMAQRFNKAPASCTTERVVEMDEQFHERIALLSRNSELLQSIRSINARIHFIRLVDLEKRPRSRSLGDHVIVAKALKARNLQGALDSLQDHISRKMPDIVEVVRAAVARVYVDQFDRHSLQLDESYDS